MWWLETLCGLFITFAALCVYALLRASDAAERQAEQEWVEYLDRRRAERARLWALTHPHGGQR